jgi:serine protease Do
MMRDGRNIRGFFFLSYSLLICSSFIGSASAATYSSGTGFFVSRAGYVVTNNHVIADCKNIQIFGAVALSPAKVVAVDKEYDLALLKTDALPTDEARLNNVRQPLRVNDPVVVVGYPGQSFETGKTQTREAKILKLTGPKDEEKWLSFSDALARGNSGGPLLDSSGNVAGVVVAKGKLIKRNEAAARDETVEQFDLAISLPVVRTFLDNNSVRYSQADSGIYLSADRVTDMANRFVVNVRCVLAQ